MENEQEKQPEPTNGQQQPTENTKQATISPEQWLKEEMEKAGSGEDFETLPALQFIENETVEFDISKEDIPFPSWEDGVNHVTKKIIPVTHAGVRKNLWLNTRNPLYKQILENLSNDITHFKVLQTGTQKNTKYVLVKN